jgi:hypothetical protein
MAESKSTAYLVVVDGDDSGLVNEALAEFNPLTLWPFTYLIEVLDDAGAAGGKIAFALDPLKTHQIRRWFSVVPQRMLWVGLSEELSVRVQSILDQCN